ncbi:VgrG-related protein [Streptomyces kronopolitis]|uniref:VgrG-related protein n=1 Tax=Streptomyces kronopolitis TaxID=1612435 RepID=UPI0020BD6D89|nr:VgrG-related protein [Streptomyces kronopolitis]MCL6302588.1 VgrG-related protein [Streptomyces kronopolitis]
MEQQPRHTAGVGVFVAGQELPSCWGLALAWAVVEESARASASSELGFRDAGCELPTRTGLVLGAPLKLVTRDPLGTTELFDGEVTGCEVRAGESGTFSVVLAEDLAHRLKRGRRVASYHQMSAGEIAASLARKIGLKVGEVDRTTLVYEFLTQPGVSDWDFLTQLARENGCDVFVRAGALHFKRPAAASGAPSASRARARQSPFVLEYGQNLVQVRSGAVLREQVAGVEVRGWDPARKQKLIAERRVEATPTRDVRWQVPEAAVSGEPLRLSSVPRANQNEVELFAGAMAQEIASGLTELRAVVRGEPRLRVRSAVSVSGLGDRYSGRYTVTMVRHEYHPDTGYLTEVAVCEGVDRSVVGGPGDAEAGAHRVNGLVPAEVVDIKDPDDQGRVRLRYPWLSDDYVSTWARTVQLGGSKGGGVVLPEVGDEVLVGFEQGNLDRPYVIGGLYNGVDKPSPHEVDLYDKSKGTANRRSFVSKEGHRLELLDADQGPLGVVLATGDNKFRIDLDQHGTRVAIHSDGAVAIEAQRAVQVTGQGITLDAGSGDLKLSGGQVTLSGERVEVSGRGEVKVHGGTLAEISATLVKLN